MVEEYEEIAESQYLSERLEYLDEDYGRTLFGHDCVFCVFWFKENWLQDCDAMSTFLFLFFCYFY